MPWLDPKMMELASRLMGLGITLGVYVIAGVGVGWVVDKYIGVKPWGTVLFILVGFGLGMYRAYAALTELRKSKS